ncbi:MAG TPA: hypothetical protein VL307_09565 [Chitinophagaceae bacterium]|nr:hypothetical protein [Chitinophagaceae bacterium]
MTQKTIFSKTSFSRYVYLGLFIGAIVFLAMRDYSTALILSGIALGFDPFNQQQPFGSRPRWQRAWLIVHLVLVFVLLWATIR